MSTGYGPSRLTKSLRIMFKQWKTSNKDTVKQIGQDHLGNKYFEAYRPHHHRPVKRYYDRPKPVQSFEEVVNAAHVPPAWDAWLRFRRQEPPTEEEVLEGEEYYRTQQAMAAAKKQEEPLNKPTTFSQDQLTSRRKTIPEGAYRTTIPD